MHNVEAHKLPLRKSVHSSRMRTARQLTVMGSVHPRSDLLGRHPHPGQTHSLGRHFPGRHPHPRQTPTGHTSPSIPHPLPLNRQTPVKTLPSREGRHLPRRHPHPGQTPPGHSSPSIPHSLPLNRQTPVKSLPSRNFVCGR